MRLTEALQYWNNEVSSDYYFTHLDIKEFKRQLKEKKLKRTKKNEVKK